MARTEKYLPVSSRVVVRNGVPARWYVTQKELIVTESTSTECPLTGEAVRTVTVSGVTVWFQPRMVRSRIVLETGDVDESAFNEQFSLFHYDVPSNGDSAGYSPCAELYRVAVRLTKSTWIVKAGDVPYDLMGRMQDLGCKVYCNKFDRTETRSLMVQAVEQLQMKMDEATADAEQSYHRAALQLSNSNDLEHKDYMDDEDKAVERFRKRTALIEKRLEELVKNIQAGASRFGISTNSYGHSRLSGMANMTRTRTQQQAGAYHRTTQVLATSTDSTLRALAVDAANSTLPVAIMAGALEDAGDEAGATELIEVFSLIGQGEEE